MEKYTTLNEALVKTNYLTQITELENLDLDKPVGYGSGFMVEYENDRFFVTADHTIHIDDYKTGKEQRTGKDYRVSIFNNCKDPDNFLSTIVTPLGGFYYMEKLHLDRPKEMPQLIDIAVCKMKPIHFEHPYLTDHVSFINGEIVTAGESKFILKKEYFAEPEPDENYYIFGKVHVNIVDNIRMNYTNTLKDSLKFITKSNDFFLFNTPEIIKDKKDWEGLSGSPVLNGKGECVGVLCDVLENSKSIWVMPVSIVTMYIEIAIQQERILG